MNNLVKSLVTILFISAAMFVAGCRASETDDQSQSGAESSPAAEAGQENSWDRTNDITGPEFGIWIVDTEGQKKIFQAFSKIDASDIRSLDLFSLPFWMRFWDEGPPEERKTRFTESFGDLDGDGNDEAFILLEDIWSSMNPDSAGFVLGTKNGKLNLLAVIQDGSKTSGGPWSGLHGVLMGGYITPGKLTVFRWAWDDVYSPPDKDTPWKDMMITTVYKFENGRLTAESVSGMYIREFPLGYWPKEPNIMSPEREAEFIKKAKIGDVDLSKPIEK